MPIGSFKSFGNPFSNQGPNFMNPNPMGQNPMGNGMGYPRQNLFRQILGSPQVQNHVPNVMRGFQKFMPPFGQGGQGFGPNQPFGQGQSQLFGQGQSQMFGPERNLQGFGQSGGISPFGRGAMQNQGMNFPGNIPPGVGGNFERTLDVQPPSLNPSPGQLAPVNPTSGPTRAGGFIQNILGRLGIGK